MTKKRLIEPDMSYEELKKAIKHFLRHLFLNIRKGYVLLNFSVY